MSLTRQTRHSTPQLATTALVLVMALAFAPAAQAAAPETILIHGRIASQGGGAVADGGYALSFALYSDPKAVNATWSESAGSIQVVGGRFVHALGSIKALPAKLLTDLTAPELGIKVGADAELPRVPLRAVAYARHAAIAAGLECSGCVGASQLADGAVGAKQIGPSAIAAGHVAFTWAGSKTKGGPATKALDLECSGCVSVGELKIDGELDLAGNGLKAMTVSADQVSGQTISAVSFIGGGAKLTGLTFPASKCKKSNEVVNGVAADGSLLCTPGMDATSLPADGVVQVTNGLLSNRFVDVTLSSKTPLPIPDSNPVGVFDELDVPDLGIAKSLTVHVSLTSSNISDLKVVLFDPSNAEHLLHDQSGSGTKFEGTWPAPDQQVSGDLGAWAGKNPVGKWRLKVIDNKGVQDKEDGAINAFEVKVVTISNKKIEATGDFAVHGTLVAHKGIDLAKGEAKLMRLQNSAVAPAKCQPAVLGLVYYDTKTDELMVCNGKKYKAFAANAAVGTEFKPAANCKAILDAGDSDGDGVYWLKHGAEAVKAWCDMAGGGWTLAASWAYGANKPAQWGKDAVAAANPQPDTQHAIAFADILPKPTQSKLVYLPTKQTISLSIANGAAWTFGAGGARIKVSSGDYLIWGSQNGIGPAGVCVVNGNYHTGYACDGNSSQVNGQGLFNSSTADEFCNCSTHGWKHGTGGCNATVCGAKGQVAIWLR